MKSSNQKTTEILERANAKEIASLFHNFNCDCSVYSDEADTIAELIMKNSNDFTKDIATRVKNSQNERYLSPKQAWCLAYQVVNNIEVYKVAMNDYINEVID